MNVASLLQNIIQNSPPLTHLDLSGFSRDKDGHEGAGEFILKALLNSSICNMQHLDLGKNSSWFNIGFNREDR